MRPGTTHTPEMRAALSEKMRAIMGQPSMRRMISERTKAGLANAPGRDRDLKTLRAIWKRAEPVVRQRFLSEILAPVCSRENSE